MTEQIYFRAPVATPIKRHDELYIPVIRHDSSPTLSIQSKDIGAIKDNALVALSELLSVLIGTGRTMSDPEVQKFQDAIRAINNL
jgi:hypothetical protein